MSDELYHLQQLMLTASSRPLNDAAYLLWIRGHYLDRWEQPNAKLSSELTQREAKERKEASVQKIRDAANGFLPDAFRRLQNAHPTASQADVADAVRAAVKLNADSIRRLRFGEVDRLSAYESACDAAMDENPGFSNVTRDQMIGYFGFLDR